MARLYRPDGSALVVHAHLLGPAEIRQLAAELDIRPTKTLGQNFVHDPNTVRRIVAAADITAADHVMEIGPGLGSLTLAIAEVAGSLTVVEIDPTLAARLPQTLAERAPEADVEIILKDALQLSAEDYAVVRDTAPTALVANLPYNVSVPVLLHILELFPSIERVLVMVQLEVAERLAAVPGSKIYGSPSVKASFYGAVKKAGIVGPNVFWPVPKVDSGLVRIDRYTPQTAAWSLDNSTRLQVFTVVDAAFAQRRKTLRAALKNLCGSGEAAAQACAAAGIDPTRRGETLTTAEFVALAGAVNSQQSD